MPVTAKRKLQQNLAVAAERVKKNGKRMPIHQNGRVIAALIPADDLRTLEWMDRLDLRAHRAALARARKRGEKPIPLAEVRKRLGLSS